MTDAPDPPSAVSDPSGAAPAITGLAPARVPRPLSSFVDREREVAAVLGFVRGGTRLLVVTGPGGVGKTRLAIRASEELAGDFADGVRFVDLAPVREPSLVAATIAQALGLRENPAQSIAEGLFEHLGRADLLLVLDNFEHVIDAAPIVSGLLGACPTVRVLVTSRAPLRLTAEQQLPLAPLTLPDPKSASSRSQLAGNPAVQLLSERVRSIRPDFALTDEIAAAMAGICRSLDGVPLAIELAAPRFGVLSPRALLARLDRRLTTLARNTRDAPERHRTLEAAVAWSYDLLPKGQQAAFRRLAVFAGGFTIEAAEAVSGLGAETTELFGVLVDQSLILPAGDTDTELRFRMLETVREFAFGKLVAAGEEAGIKAEHAAYFLALAEQGDVELDGREQAAWAVRLDGEHDNFRTALAWCLSHGETAELALRLSGALWRFWDRLGYVREARDSLERVLDLTEGRVSAGRAKAMFSLGNVLYQNPERARQQYEGSLRVYRSLGDLRGTARALRGLAFVAANRDDVAAAQRAYLESLRLSRLDGDRAGVAMTLHHLGFLDVKQGRLEDGRKRLEEALQHWEALGNMTNSAYALRWLGRLRNLQGEPSDAVRLLAQAQELFAAVRDEDGAAYVAVEACLAEVAAGDFASARGHLRSALQSFGELENTDGVVFALEATAEVAVRSNRPDAAARFWGTTSAWRDDAESPLSAYDASLVARGHYVARDRLGAARFTTAWNEGRSRSLNDALSDALDFLAVSTSAVATALHEPKAAATTDPTAWARAQGLTSRETEILPFLIAGRTDQQIAASLFISRRTVTTHVSSILHKLDVPSRTAVAAISVRHGM